MSCIYVVIVKYIFYNTLIVPTFIFKVNIVAVCKIKIFLVAVYVRLLEKMYKYICISASMNIEHHCVINNILLVLLIFIVQYPTHCYINFKTRICAHCRINTHNNNIIIIRTSLSLSLL